MSTDNSVEFTRLWTNVQPNVMAYISASVRQFSDAQDVVQNVAVAAVKKFDDYDRAKPFAGWIIGIARVEVLRYLRQHAKDRHQLVDEDVLVQLAGTWERNLNQLEEERAALMQCLKLLRGRPREMIEHRYGSGLKTAEIAEITGLKPGYVSVSLNRAYQQLRACIDRRRSMGADA